MTSFLRISAGAALLLAFGLSGCVLDRDHERGDRNRGDDRGAQSREHRGDDGKPCAGRGDDEHCRQRGN